MGFNKQNKLLKLQLAEDDCKLEYAEGYKN